MVIAPTPPTSVHNIHTPLLYTEQRFVRIKSPTMRCLNSALTIDGSLSADEVKKRTIMLVFCVVSVVATLISSLLHQARTHAQHRIVNELGSCIIVTTGCVAIVKVLCKQQLHTTFVVGVLYFSGIGIFMWDLQARTYGIPGWPLLIVVVDMLLVMQVPSRYSAGFVGATVVWLFLMACEESFRFGLFDLPGLLPHEGEHSRRALILEKADCEFLPCKTSFPPLGFVSTLAVFLIDFFVTRRFAHNVLKEQESMIRTISVVQEIASLLAGYDVEQVAEMLDVHGGDLPEGMTAALWRLEKNLRMYKAYLPKTCLPFEDEVDSESEGGELTETTDPSTESSHSRNENLPVCLPLGLSSVKATLLTLNVKDTLHLLEKDSTSFSSFFTTLLLKTLQATETRRGMVDVFIGDRIHCSFNASKQCATHATSALHAASLLLKGASSFCEKVNAGVATGKVLRGDMGCEVMRRFSMVGELVRDVNGLERVGRMLGCDVVCNRMCFSDAECEHQLRLLPCKVEVASGCEAQVVAEVMAQLSDAEEAVDEWMYMIGGKKHWEEYNIAVRGYLRGEQSDLDVAEAWTAAGGVGTPAHAVPSGTCSVVCCSQMCSVR